MTISTTTSTVAYVGDGVTTDFPVPYAFFDSDEIEVVERITATGVETVKALTSDYIVTGGAGTTGTVKATGAVPSTVTWTIRRKTDRTQLTDYVPNDAFPAEAHERALDRAIAIIQELERDGARSFQVPKTDAAPALVPNSVQRASLYAGFDASGNMIALAAPVGTTPVTGFMATLLDDVDAAAGRATLGVTPANLAQQYRAPFLTNGRFDVWQASTSLAIAASATTTAAIYAADQWCMETSANQACVVSRQAGTGTARYRVRVQRNAGQTGVTALRFQQPLEIWDVLRLRGQVVTVSCTALAGATFSGALRMKILTGTGTESRRTNAGAYTGEATPLDVPMALTTSDATYSGTSTAISASATRAALVFEWTPSGTAGAADLFELQDVWLDFGAVAGAMPYEPIEQTTARCQRFFWKTLGALNYVGNAAAATQNQLVLLKFPVTMRATPTVSATFSGGVNVASVNVLNANADMAQPYGVSVAGGTTGYAYDAGNTADARL